MWQANVLGTHRQLSITLAGGHSASAFAPRCPNARNLQLITYPPKAKRIYVDYESDTPPLLTE